MMQEEFRAIREIGDIVQNTALVPSERLRMVELVLSGLRSRLAAGPRSCRVEFPPSQAAIYPADRPEIHG